MTFKDGATVLGTVALVNVGASLVTSTLAAGAHSLTASSSDPVQRVRHFVTFTATVSAVAPAIGTPTRTVTIMDGTTAIATVRVNAAEVATFVTRNLAIATHSMTAVYNGDATFLSSTSAAVIVTITP